MEEDGLNPFDRLTYLLYHVSPPFMMCDLHDVGVSAGDNLTGESVPPRETGRQAKQVAQEVLRELLEE